MQGGGERPHGLVPGHPHGRARPRHLLRRIGTLTSIFTLCALALWIGTALAATGPTQVVVGTARYDLVILSGLAGNVDAQYNGGVHLPFVPDYLTLTLTSQPTHGSVTHAATGFVYLPVYQYFGQDTFSYRVCAAPTGDTQQCEDVGVFVVVQPLAIRIPAPGGLPPPSGVTVLHQTVIAPIAITPSGTLVYPAPAVTVQTTTQTPSASSGSSSLAFTGVNLFLLIPGIALVLEGLMLVGATRLSRPRLL